MRATWCRLPKPEAIFRQGTHPPDSSSTYSSSISGRSHAPSDVEGDWERGEATVDVLLTPDRRSVRI